MGRRAGSRNLDYDWTRDGIVANLATSILSSERSNLSFRELAHAAGVSPSTLRHYFPDRGQVIQAVLARIHELGLRYIAEGSSADRGPAPEALRWFLSYLAEGWARGVGKAHVLGLVEGLGEPSIGPAYLRTLLEPSLQSAEARVALHVARGELGPCDVRQAAVELVAPVIVALLHQQALGGKGVRPLELEPFLDEHVRRFLRAYAPTSAVPDAPSPP
ncbi:MAG TPA: TetR/AcrR family transcriptional regulator [Anaeromyxobacteraceae bacterium]|nr:TetR/AcrR family transcriptional regulator [Anaeromyxobacteraceae bacterium]